MKILVLGDSPLGVGSALARAKMDMTVSSGLTHAIDCLGRERFDVVLLGGTPEEADVLCRSLREATHVPIAFVTSATRADWRQLVRLDVDSYVPDNVGEQEIVARLKAIARRCATTTPRELPVKAELSGNGRRILVAAGDEDDLCRVERMLRALRHTVTLAHDGEVASAAAREAPDLIVLGGHQATTDWTEVIKELKANETTRAIPVALVTPPSAVAERLKAIEAGVDDFLAMPLDNIELQVTVKLLLRIACYARQLRDYHEDMEVEVLRRTSALKQALRNTEAVSLDTIYRLSRAAEFRDEDAHGHIERMSHYSTAIARRLGLDEAFRQNILFASPLHDIGKISIPDSILRKPGKLDDEEWQIIRQHSPFGAKILEDSEAEILKMAHTIAATHHEKWDGTGYPHGLKGEEIPFAGRIASIADVFDVLTWERPYKRPVPLEKAFATIKEGRGSHFDPAVVDAFFDIEEEITAEFNWWKFIGFDSDSDQS
ncbi:MAG: HD domain-containing protein [Chloroflexi bacterium]|nr:HD domain-containing protein [Chloroflexota bacterium]